MIGTVLKTDSAVWFLYERCESREHFNTNRGPSTVSLPTSKRLRK